MENNKYFTPDILDIHVGYECEIYENEQYVSYVIPHVIVGGNTRIDIPCGSHWSIQNKLRVPFLTKEQIKAEGWILQSETGFFIKGKYELYYNQQWNNDKEFSLQILEQPNFMFKGFCKDINTFRKIIKLLGI